MQRGGYVYIMTNRNNTVLYVGVTSLLRNRIIEHRMKRFPNSFTSRYNISKLVYFEGYTSIVEAIAREKQIKGGSRAKKIELINGFNPDWNDLFNEDLE